MSGKDDFNAASHLLQAGFWEVIRARATAIEVLAPGNRSAITIAALIGTLTTLMGTIAKDREAHGALIEIVIANLRKGWDQQEPLRDRIAAEQSKGGRQ